MTDDGRLTGARQQSRNWASSIPRLLESLFRLDRPLVAPAVAPARFDLVVVASILLGLLAGIATSMLPSTITLGGVGVGDIGPPLVGTKLFLDGQSPYQVRLGAVAITLYPFTTSIALAPLLLLAPKLWAPAFVAVITALLAFSILVRGEPWRLLMLLSVPYWSAVYSVQWSPVFAAALLLPALLPVAVVKPQLGLVLALSGRWRRRELVVAFAFVAISVALLPSWPILWIRQGRLAEYAGRSPVLLGIGVLLLSAAFLWRDGRARLLLGMSLIAQRYFYDQLLLFLIPRNATQMLVLLGASWAGALTAYDRRWWVPASGVQETSVWHVAVITIFLPCLVMVWLDRKRPVPDAPAA